MQVERSFTNGKVLEIIVLKIYTNVLQCSCLPLGVTSSITGLKAVVGTVCRSVSRSPPPPPLHHLSDDNPPSHTAAAPPLSDLHHYTARAFLYLPTNLMVVPVSSLPSLTDIRHKQLTYALISMMLISWRGVLRYRDIAVLHSSLYLSPFNAVVKHNRIEETPTQQ